MSDKEYFEACVQCVEWINCVHAEKRKPLLAIRKSYGKYSLVRMDNNEKIAETEFLDKFFQKVSGIASYVQEFV